LHGLGWMVGLAGTLALGCTLGSEPIGEENDTGGSGSEGGSESASASMTGNSATASMTTDPATSVATDTDDETSAGQTTDDTETGGPAAACDMPAPNALGGWALDLGDFPGGDEFSLDLVLDCTIVGVNVNMSTSLTEWDLSCLDDEGLPHAVGFDIAVSHDGVDGLAALVELPAELRIVGAQDFGGVIGGAPQATELAVASIALVGDGQVYGFVVQGPAPATGVFDPIEITFDRDACGVDPDPEDPDYDQEERDMAVTISIEDNTATLFSGQWDVLVLDGGATTDTITIDVLEATAMTCCHSSTWISMVGRTYREYAKD
jgi:hypothetical protein